MNNPYGSYTRHNTTTAEHMAALWKEVAREHAARSSSARRYARACHDSMDAAIRRANKAERALASAEFDAATHRADRDAAEEERDEALDALRDLGAAHRALQGLAAEIGRAEQPRALTPDAITDSHVLSARLKANALGWFGRFDAPAEEWRQVLTAALTEPPSRPEWEDAPYVWADSAQGGGRVIWKRSTSDDGRVIWSSGGTWHPSWMLTNPAPVVPEGVRVVTEEEARHATDE